MHYGIAALWGMKTLVKERDTVAAGQISEPAVTDQKDLGQHSSFRRPVFFIFKRQPREYKAQHGRGKTTVHSLS